MATHTGIQMKIMVRGLDRATPRTGDMTQMVDDLARHGAIKPTWLEAIGNARLRVEQFRDRLGLPPRLAGALAYHGTGRLYRYRLADRDAQAHGREGNK